VSIFKIDGIAPLAETEAELQEQAPADFHDPQDRRAPGSPMRTGAPRALLETRQPRDKTSRLSGTDG